MTGHLVALLRQPDIPRKGHVSRYFERNEFPLMTTPQGEGHLNEIFNSFQNAGYKITKEISDNGLWLFLDWRNCQEECEEKLKNEQIPKTQP